MNIFALHFLEILVDLGERYDRGQKFEILAKNASRKNKNMYKVPT